MMPLITTRHRRHERTHKDLIQEEFEHRGRYTPWWAFPTWMRFAAGGIPVLAGFTIAFLGAGTARETRSAGVGLSLVMIGAMIALTVISDELERWAVDVATCPNLDSLDEASASVLADALQEGRKYSYCTRVGAQTAVYRNRAAVLAALHLAARGKDLPKGATGPAVLDQLIVAAHTASASSESVGLKAPTRT